MPFDPKTGKYVKIECISILNSNTELKMRLFLVKEQLHVLTFSGRGHEK